MANEILLNLPYEDANLLRTHVRRVRLVPGQVVVEQGHAVEHVYFVEEGLVSLLAGATGHRSGVQVAMIGREGFVGSDALLDGDRATRSTAIVQIPGWASRLTSQDLRKFCAESAELRRRCLGAISSLFQQVIETSACTARSTLVERAARWLLMAHQRVGYGELFVTHEALSSMLGVRRSGVSVVLAALQDANLITISRGRIIVRDRAGLGGMLNGQANRETSALSGGKVVETHIAAESRAVQRGDRAHSMDGEGLLP